MPFRAFALKTSPPEETGMQKLGVAVIGCGQISSSHLAAYRSLAEECEVIAVCDVSEAAARRRAAEFEVSEVHTDYRRLLEDERVRVVSVCTPHFMHAPISIAAARAGKHIICEKPMAMTVGECHEMIAAARANGVRLTVGSERVNPRYRFIHDRVLPEIGPVEEAWLIDFYLRDSAYYASGAWRGTWAQEGGGILINQAIYTWDQMADLLGGVDYAYGYWTNLLHPTIEVEDLAYGLVRFKSDVTGGVFATSCCDWLCDGPEAAGLRIVGERGRIFDTEPWLYSLNFHLEDRQADAALHADFERVLLLDYNGRYQPIQSADLFAAIRERRDPIVTGESAMEAVKILNGIHWHGWRHAPAFRAWAETFELPSPSTPGARPTVDDAKAQGWKGGPLMVELRRMTREAGPRLECPLLESQ
jgi:UDP-N-acetyl-2-amino-2-deoxyglucuronate dehydrogenase